jgi:hypothetical protein
MFLHPEWNARREERSARPRVRLIDLHLFFMEGLLLLS